MESHQFSLRLVITAESIGGRQTWVAQCVEYDLATQSDSPAGALEAFRHLIEDRFRGAVKRGVEDPFAGLRPAPARIRERFEERGRSLEIPSTSMMMSDRQQTVRGSVEARVAAL